jgi:hypothetical protein
VLSHVLWTGKDNEASLQLTSAGANLTPEQYDAITRLVIRLRPIAGGADVLLDSSVTPGLLAWGGSVGALVMIEGGKLPDVPVPAGDYRARVIAYSVDQPQGVVFVDFNEYGFSIRT